MPTLPPALISVYALLQRRDFAAAEPLAQQAARDFPDLEAAWLLWANALAGQARYVDLERLAADALRRHPSSFDLTIALVTAARQTLRPELAAEALRNFTTRFPDHLPAAAGLAQQLNYTPDTDPEAIFTAHQRFGQLLARNTNSPAPPTPATTLDPHRPLRVAILSADLVRHSVAHFLLPIARHWPRDGSMHLTLISTAQRTDDITQRFRDTGHPLLDAGTLTPPQLDALIRQHAIDLLIECNGPADGSRLSALSQQPATIQLSYCGYPAITGCPFIQHRLVDSLTDPPNLHPSTTDQPQTHESLLRIDPCFLTYAPLDEPPAAPAFAAPPSSAPHQPRPITLGCFNQLHKLNAPLLDDWAAILLALPGSVLVIKSAALHHEASRRVLAEAFASRGIAPDRIRPTPWIADPCQHLALYHDIDLALDTFPYHGTTTTCEALLMGVPVITRAGQTHASRVGVSLLHAINAPELIAADRADYRARAIALARDAERLRTYRQTLPQRLRESSLMDHAGFTGRLIATLRAAWIARCAR